MVTKWGIRHQWHVPVPTTDSVKQTLTIFWAPIFSRGLKICNSNLPGEDLWERKQKEIHCILSACHALSQLQEAKGWAPGHSLFLLETKPNLQYLENTPAPNSQHLPCPAQSGVSTGQAATATGWPYLRDREKGPEACGVQEHGLVDVEKGWGLWALHQGHLWMALGKWGSLFLFYFCLFLKPTFHLVLKRTESNELFH